MKRLISIFALIPMMFFSSCEVEMSDNGDLDGYWQLARVDTIGGGSCEMVTSRVFWSVQMNLLEVSKVGSSKYFFRFKVTDDYLKVYDPYLSARNKGDVQVTDVQVLKPYGIQGLEEDFKIERLDGKKMTICSEMLRLDFNRY